MAFFDRFRKKQDKEKLEKIAEVQEGKTSKNLELKKNISKTEFKKAPAKKTVKKASVKKRYNKEGVKLGGAKIKSKFKNESESILVKPLITEKISDLAALGKYSFAVKNNANKISVKKAVSAVYGVKVDNVRIINIRGKKVRYGRNWGRTKNWKKAIVTLAPGEKIELYEGV